MALPSTTPGDTALPATADDAVAPTTDPSDPKVGGSSPNSPLDAILWLSLEADTHQRRVMAVNALDELQLRRRLK